MIELGNFLCRVVAVLYASLLPIAAPLDVRPLTDRAGLAARLTGSAIVCLAAIALVVWVARRSRVGAALLGAVVASAGVSAAIFTGAHGPVGRVVPFLAIPLWIGLAMSAVAVAATFRPLAPRFGARNTALVGAALGGVSLIVAYPRLESRESMWNTVLRRDPGNEDAATYVADARRRAGRVGEALDVLRACARANPAACSCVVGAMDAALAAESPKDALLLANAAGACGQLEDVTAMRAEALVTAGDASGEPLAQEILKRRPRDPHALYAIALGQAARGDTTATLAFARQAVDAGRGMPAQLLVAVTLMGQGDLDGARAVLRQIAAVDPSIAKVRYDLALIADRKNEYREAREGYLAALQIDPKMADARYNLVLLTFRNGVVAEAHHHLDKLIEIAPDDPRIEGLRAQLGPAPQ